MAMDVEVSWYPSKQVRQVVPPFFPTFVISGITMYIHSAELVDWREPIRFLNDKLALALNPKQLLLPIKNGNDQRVSDVDFLNRCVYKQQK